MFSSGHIAFVTRMYLIFMVYLSFIRYYYVLTPNPCRIFRVGCSIYRLFDCFSAYFPIYTGIIFVYISFMEEALVSLPCLKTNK